MLASGGCDRLVARNRAKTTVLVPAQKHGAALPHGVSCRRRFARVQRAADHIRFRFTAFPQIWVSHDQHIWNSQHSSTFFCIPLPFLLTQMQAQRLDSFQPRIRGFMYLPWPREFDSHMRDGPYGPHMRPTWPSPLVLPHLVPLKSALPGLLLVALPLSRSARGGDTGISRVPRARQLGPGS